MKFTYSLTILLLLPATGCQRALHITVVNAANAPQFTTPKALPGLPFNVRVGACRQTTTYLERQYEITDTTTGQEKTVGQTAFTGFQSAATKSIAFAELAPIGTPIQFDNLFVPPATTGSGSSTGTPPVEKPSPDVYMATNTATMESVPDYSKTYYINSGRPLTGTAHISTTIDADGVLTTVDSQVQDQTVSSLLTTAPAVAPTLGVSLHQPSRIPEAESPTPPHPDTYSIKERHFLHTFTAITSGISCPTSASGLQEGSYTVIDADATPPAPKPPVAPK